jgi:signal transduction histidine kinase
MSAPENPEAAFIAKITASTTHEIRNVLAIVKESAGLVEDVVHSLGPRGLPNQDKLLRAVGRIDAQVSRGAELMSNLNRLAHCLDRAQDRIDLNQEVQQAALLCQRFASRRKQLLQVQPGGQELPVSVNPLRLQMALFTAVECCIDQLPEASTVTVRMGHQGDRPTVEFIGETGEGSALPSPTEAPGWSRLAELLGGIRASVEAFDTEYRFLIVLPLAGAA